jgi:vacuolar-type H+-ATPase subunit I/STV1
MKTLALLLAVISGAAAASAADVVETAKAAKANRRKSTSRVITNRDVKKSKGTLAENKVPAKPADAPKEVSLVEQQETMRRERAAREARLSAAAETVARLEKEVAALEQQYYDENDLDRRDTDLVRRFNEAKSKLDAARAELEKP